MNNLQKCEFELLKVFIGICERLRLDYYLVCGSALGAVKYGGFIPWDDDIDVALRREDYRQFIEKAPALLPPYYFLQTYRTDPQFPGFYCKLRDSRTTFIEKSVREIMMNHGVYIDVFPLDGYPSDRREAKRLERRKAMLKRLIDSAYAVPEEQKMLTRVFFTAERLLGCHKRTGKYAERMEKLISAYPLDDSELWCNHGNWQGTKEYAPREQYGGGREAVFEGLKVMIPEQYDAYLTQKYGDWRADLPEEEKIGHHFCAVCDLTRPYIDYLNKKNKESLLVRV